MLKGSPVTDKLNREEAKWNQHSQFGFWQRTKKIKQQKIIQGKWIILKRKIDRKWITSLKEYYYYIIGVVCVEIFVL